MQIYIKSAGFSVNQDYSWINQSGKSIEMDLVVSSYNVDGVKFVWKNTGEAIYIFANAFIDKSRTDLYNRPLRNYVLLVGQMEEAELMFGCFGKMLLEQKEFEIVLNNSIRNEAGDSKTGFSVDFQSISSYFSSNLFSVGKVCKLKRHLYENDSYEARQALLEELWSVKRKSVTLLVGGELSERRLQILLPDRALLNHISNRGNQSLNTDKIHLPFKAMAALGAALLTVSVLVLVTKD
ncbi:MAG: hypothetical protein NC489_31445 [Ruminococcus flavefaciens]|nr:hypothetical protein [Ruminococcus flavefaciens]